MAKKKSNTEVEPVVAGQVTGQNADADKKVAADAGATPATQAAEPKSDQAQQDAAQGAQAASTATETPKVSDYTIQAEKEAQRSLGAAKKTIEHSAARSLSEPRLSAGRLARHSPSQLLVSAAVGRFPAFQSRPLSK